MAAESSCLSGFNGGYCRKRMTKIARNKLVNKLPKQVDKTKVVREQYEGKVSRWELMSCSCKIKPGNDGKLNQAMERMSFVQLTLFLV